jgi:hypothetical protein
MEVIVAAWVHGREYRSDPAVLQNATEVID